MKKIEDKIQKHSEDRERQLQRRARNGVQTVSIIGYTNAGKTSLFNALTGRKNEVQNALFVTLDSSTSKIFLPKSKKELLISDTIGFIRNLPASLIDAFKSTLMESIHADILLFVIDVSDEDYEQKIQVVEEVLYELHIQNKKRIYVFNKIDAVENLDKSSFAQYSEYSPQFISVKKNEGIEKLLEQIEESLNSKREEVMESAKRKRIHV